MSYTYYLNGEYVPIEEAKVSVLDAVCHGDSVFDTLRTVNRTEVFRIDDHLDRLYSSCRAALLEPTLSPGEMKEVILEVVKRNAPFLAENDDAWILPRVSSGLLVAPGPAHTMVLFIPLPFRTYAKFFKQGTHLVVPQVRHVPPQSMDAKMKHDSRLFMHIGDREARAVDPEARTLLLDVDGNVAELTDANIFIVKRGTVMTPPLRNVLPGVSRMTVLELCEKLGIPAVERDFQLFDLYNADEAFQSGTSYRMLPVSRVNQRHLWNDVPGAITRRILDAYSEELGLDIAEQYLSHLSDEERQALEAEAVPAEAPAPGLRLAERD